MICIEILNKRDGESNLEYIWRLGNYKDNGITDKDWDELADIINRNLYDDESEFKCSSAYRKPYQSAKMFYENVFNKNNGNLPGESELYIEKVKARDERNEISRLLREQARRESFIDLVRSAIVENAKPFEPRTGEFGGDNAIVVHLTDMHAGICIKNSKNTYNENILYDRLQDYLGRIKEIAERHNANECHLLLGGDMISGLIHPNLRLENNMNVIQQVKTVCNYVSEFVYCLLDMFNTVYVHSVSGNHSRLSPNKEQHLNGEELDALVPFYLSTVFKQFDNVQVDTENENGDYISVFDVKGHLFAGFHGDKDSPQNAVNNATKIIGTVPDVVMLGHRHTNSLITADNGSKVVQSGSMSGTDNYSYDARLFAKPEQMVVVTSYKRPIEALYDVQFSV